MTDKRDRSGTDQRVSDVYRELAGEHAPEDLNKRVLRMAAYASRTRYSIARGWMRPVAWAATIGLSLAIVMQLTSLPQAELDSIVELAAEPDAPSPQDLPQPTTEVRRDDNVSMEEFEPQDMAVVHDAEELARAQAGPVKAPAIEPEVAAVASFARSAEKRGVRIPGLCPEENRESAEEWYRCIEALRVTASDDELARELEEFQEKFPEFAGLPADK